MTARETVESRIERYTDRNGPIPAHMPHLGNCWLWTGGKIQDGYGVMNIENKQTKVTRYLMNPPRDKVIMHLCDQPSCIRKSHLKVASQAENMADAAKKGRMWRKLTIDEVREIRKLRFEYSSYEVGKMFNVNPTSIWKIWNGVTFKYVP